MTDIREDILARLLAIAEAIDSVETAKRNVKDVSEDNRPAIIINDADEAAEEADPRGRSGSTPRRVIMTPEVLLLLGDRSQDVGTGINALRAKWLKAVLTDPTLKDIVGTNGEMRYEGCATSLASGRTMQAEMGVSISFTYIFRPADL